VTPSDAIDSARWTNRPTLDEPVFRLGETPFVFGVDLDCGGADLAPGGTKQPDVFGQKAAVDTLHDLCLQALGWRRNGSNGERRSTTIALYGRYGQGKSTVLSGVRRALGSENDGAPSRIRCAEFDVADHRPDQMTYDFDRLVGEWTLRNRILHYVVFLCFLVALFALTERFGGFGFAAAVLVPYFFKPVGDAIRMGVGEERLVRRLESLWRFNDRAGIARLWKAQWRGKPDVLIVDNLDRATVDQQRAFLRGLRRHRSNLPTAVIVAFDETPLAMSDPNPEAPQELLGKVFTTVVRLYPMTKEDVHSIVDHLYDRLQDECGSDADSPLRFLRYPAVAGDLARIFLAHRRHSVRFCYQFLNIAATASVTLRIDHPADFSALMRLQGLFEFLPWIRHDPSALADMIAQNDADALLAHAAGILGKDKLSSEVIDAVRKYLTLTNHMQPYFADWQTFTGRFGLARPELAGGDPPENGAVGYWFPGPAIFTNSDTARTFWRKWVETDLNAAAEQIPARRRVGYEDAIRQAGRGDGDGQGRLSTIFLVHRLWLGDGEAACPPPMAALERELLFDANNSAIPEAPLQQEEQNAFLQILRAAPLQIVPFFETIIVSGSLRSDKFGRPSDGERRWLNALERRAGERRRGCWPTLFGKPLVPSGRAYHAVAALDELDVPTDPAAFNWTWIRRRIDLLGRLQRQQGDSTLTHVKAFVDKTLALHPDNPTILKELLLAMAAGFPSFDDSGDDGRWLLKAFDPFDSLAMTLFGETLTPPIARMLRDLSGVQVAPHILLMALHYGLRRLGKDPLPTFKHFELVATRWKPPRRWPISYLGCVAKIAQDIAGGDAAFGCDAHRALWHSSFHVPMRRATDQLGDDPLDFWYRDAVIPPPLPN